MSTMEESDVNIREVWKENMGHEFELIRDVVDKYPYVAIDTEFPGVVVRPVGDPKDYNYQTLKANVRITKLIQLGLTFSDDRGNLPAIGPEKKRCVWQFNFHGFDPKEDVCNPESINLLSKSGIDFKKNNRNGVNGFRFSELLMSSGAVLNDEVHWITFHGAYDIGYLIKFLSGKDLPDTEEKFFDLVKVYLPNLYDIKYLMKFTNNLYGGLSKLAFEMGVKRIGMSHQAGSDSFVTSCVFMKAKEYIFSGNIPGRLAGVLYGMGVDEEKFNHLKAL